MNQIKFSERKMIIGFKTVILGLFMYVVELLFLPVFGRLQKEHVNGQGFHSDFWDYTGQQPYPVIFIITGIIILLGVISFINGYKDHKQGEFK